MDPRALLVLVIESSSNTLEVWESALTLAGFTVATAASAIEGLRRAASLSPAAIVTYLHFPDMDGTDLIRALKDRHRRAAIVGVTEHSRPIDRVRAEMIGCNAVLVRSCTPERLVTTVLDLLERRYRRAERRRVARGGRRSTDPSSRR